MEDFYSNMPTSLRVGEVDEEFVKAHGRLISLNLREREREREMENLSSVMPTRVRERMLNQECVKAHGRLFSYLELSRVGPVTYFHIRSRKVLVQLFPFSLLSNFSI